PAQACRSARCGEPAPCAEAARVATGPRGTRPPGAAHRVGGHGRKAPSLLDLSRLSPAQRQAVLAGDGPLLIVAGPGSGKTTVLAARIAHLVLVRGVGPASVLAVTFTRAAARELRHRLRGILGDLADNVDITTLHALGF